MSSVGYGDSVSMPSRITEEINGERSRKKYFELVIMILIGWYVFNIFLALLGKFYEQRKSVDVIFY
jgi:hypothetical protein